MPQQHLKIVLLLLLSVMHARAQESEPQPLDPPLDLAQPLLESQWQPESFFAFAYGDEGETYALHVGSEWRGHPNPDFRIAPQLVFAAANNTDDAWSALTGFDLQLRFYQEPVGSLEWFFEIGAGIQYVGPESFPRSGTHLNGRLRAGIGGRYQANDRVDLLAGLGWLHMSNGNALQPNVGHDGPMAYLGVSVDF